MIPPELARVLEERQARWSGLGNLGAAAIADADGFAGLVPGHVNDLKERGRFAFTVGRAWSKSLCKPVAETLHRYRCAWLAICPIESPDDQ